MGTRRQMRELALQTLYELDARGEQDAAAVLESVRSRSEQTGVREEAARLAEGAWRGREAADALSASLAPDWPPHRQPVVDRSILRLAHYELFHTRTPAPVVIDEAVELAKRYGSERSPAFVNGVLDGMARRVGLESPPPEPPPADPWLDDALRQARPTR